MSTNPALSLDEINSFIAKNDVKILFSVSREYFLGTQLDNIKDSTIALFSRISDEDLKSFASVEEQFPIGWTPSNPGTDPQSRRRRLDEQVEQLQEVFDNTDFSLNLFLSKKYYWLGFAVGFLYIKPMFLLFVPFSLIFVKEKRTYLLG